MARKPKPLLPFLRIACTGPGAVPCPESINVAMESIADTAAFADVLKSAGWKIGILTDNGDDVVFALCSCCTLVVQADMRGELAVSGGVA